MPEIPARIKRQIAEIDRTLRLRWSREKRLFMLERKAEKRFLPAPVLFRTGYEGVHEIIAPEYSDRYIQHHDGYVEVMRFPVLPKNIVAILKLTDTAGKAKSFVKEFEAREAAVERKKEQEKIDNLNDISGAAFDSIAWREGRRTMVSGLKEVAA